MCLILLAWQAHPDYPLVVAANRDEFFARPRQCLPRSGRKPRRSWPGAISKPAAPGLGSAAEQRFAALTNYREGGKQPVEARSRGALVADFLTGRSPGRLSGAGRGAGAAYNGFNLFVGDGESLGYYSNRGDGRPRWLKPGIYGLSNHLLDTPWPKLASAKAAFAAALATLPAQAPFLDLLADQEIVPDTHLPETGVPLEWERILSAVFVARQTTARAPRHC
jgi:uncharacterized protein with NRDE domain